MEFLLKELAIIVNGSACPKCSKRYRRTIEEWIELFKNDPKHSNCDYSLVKEIKKRFRFNSNYLHC